MSITVYGKTIEHLRNRVDISLVKNNNCYLKWASKPSYLSTKNVSQQFGRFSKLKALNKPVYVGMCIIEVRYQCVNSIIIISKTNMATNWDYDSQILRLVYVVETAIVYAILVRIKKYLILVIVLQSKKISIQKD